VAVKQQVSEIIQSRREQLIDVRSVREFDGIESRAARYGAIPSARHSDWSAGLEPYYYMRRFKSLEDLTKAFQGAKIDPTQPIIIYGQARDRGALMAFNLERIGATSVRLYYRGWDEWGNAKDTPITGPVPKTPPSATAPPRSPQM
jgi:thiosulfate/3-mercaptopyruvate sulfurtransferase